MADNLLAGLNSESLFRKPDVPEIPGSESMLPKVALSPAAQQYVSEANRALEEAVSSTQPAVNFQAPTPVRSGSIGGRASGKSSMLKSIKKAPGIGDKGGPALQDVVGNLLSSLYATPAWQTAGSDERRAMLDTFNARLPRNKFIASLDPEKSASVLNLVRAQGDRELDSYVDDLKGGFFSDSVKSIRQMGGVIARTARSYGDDRDIARLAFLESDGSEAAVQQYREALRNSGGMVYVEDPALLEQDKALVGNAAEIARLRGGLLGTAAKNEVSNAKSDLIQASKSPQNQDIVANQQFKDNRDLADDGVGGLQYYFNRFLDIATEPANTIADNAAPLVTMAGAAGVSAFTRNPAAVNQVATVLGVGGQVASGIVDSVASEVRTADISVLQQVPGWDSALRAADGNEDIARGVMSSAVASGVIPAASLVGLVTSVTGVEKAAGGLSNLVVSRISSKAAGRIAQNSGGRLASTAGLTKRVIASTAFEGSDGALEQLATNYGLDRGGIDTDLTSGLAKAAVTEAAGGFIIGGGLEVATSTIRTLTREKIASAPQSPTPQSPALPGQVAPAQTGALTQAPTPQQILEQIPDAGANPDPIDVTTSIGRALDSVQSVAPGQMQEYFDSGMAITPTGQALPFDESPMYQSLSPEGQNIVREAVRRRGINTNPFATTRDQDLLNEPLDAGVPADQLADRLAESYEAGSIDYLTVDAIALKKARIDGAPDPAIGLTYPEIAKAILEVQDAVSGIRQFDATARSAAALAAMENSTADLTKEDGVILTQYLVDKLGLGIRPRRLTDAETQRGFTESFRSRDGQGDNGGDSGSSQPPGAQSASNGSTATQTGPSTAGDTGRAESSGNTRPNEVSAPEAGLPSQSAAGTQPDGQAGGTPQPTGQPQPGATSQTSGGGGTGNAAPERNTNGGSTAPAVAPKSLSTASTNFGASGGGVSSRVVFASDVDKAAWLVRSGKKKLPRNAQAFIEYVSSVTGMTETQVRVYGERVHGIAKALKKADQNRAEIPVPAQNTPTRSASSAEAVGEVELNEAVSGLSNEDQTFLDTAYEALTPAGGPTKTEWLQNKIAEEVNSPKAAGPRLNEVIKKLVAALSKALTAIVLTVTLYNTSVAPQSAMANTTIATQGIQNQTQLSDNANTANRFIQGSRDNGGKPYVIADKTSGKLFIMNQDGSVRTTTPALFGKEKTDTRQVGSTPAGRFHLQSADTNVPGYGGDVQVFVDQTSTEGAIAIHRVINVPGESRQGRLDSGSASDNRISLGCINIPEEVYDANFSGDFDGLIYVLPESDSYTGERFGLSNSPETNQPAVSAGVVSDGSRSGAARTPEPQSSTEQRREGAGAAQVRPATSTAVDEAEASRDAERETNEAEYSVNFDAEPVNDSPAALASGAEVTTDGMSIADIAAMIASALGAIGGGLSIARMRSRRNPLGTADIGREDPLVPESDLKVTVTPQSMKYAEETELEDLVNEGAWKDLLLRDVTPAPLDYSVDQIAASLRKWIADTTKQAPSFNTPPPSRKELKFGGTLNGVRNKVLRGFGNIPVSFIGWLGRSGDRVTGGEFDSFEGYAKQRQVKAKTQSMSRLFEQSVMGPVRDQATMLALDYNITRAEAETAIGEYSTYYHLINEGFQYHLDRLGGVVAALEAEIAPLQAYLANPTPDNLPEGYGGVTTVNLALDGDPSSNDADAKEGLLNRLGAAQNTLAFTTTAIDEDTMGQVKLPGGMTRPEAKAAMADLVSKYKLADLERGRELVVRGYQNIVTKMADTGAVSAGTLKQFRDTGFTSYVSLQLASEDVQANSPYPSDDDLVKEFRTFTNAANPTDYKREGSRSRASNAVTNLSRFKYQASRSIGEAAFSHHLRVMFEGVDARARKLTEDEVKSIPSEFNGLRRSLNRLRPQDGGEAKAYVRGWGTDKQGNEQLYYYYFVDPTINEEIGQVLDNSQEGALTGVLRAATGLKARAVTAYTPTWAAMAPILDAAERGSILLTRNYVDSDGVRIPKRKVALEYARAVKWATSNSAGVFSYMRGDPADPTGNGGIQQILSELDEAGALSIHTDLVLETDATYERPRSKLGSKIRGKYDRVLATTRLRRASDAVAKVHDGYIQLLVEAPQLVPVVASYRALLELGVSREEALLRVRDQYDPSNADPEALSEVFPFMNRAIFKNASAFYPFIRSSLTGVYNVQRSLLTEPKDFAIVMAALIIGFTSISAVLGFAFGDDEDGTPRNASLDMSIMSGGVVIPWGDEGVATIPHGHAIPRIAKTISDAAYKMAYGKMSGDDAFIAAFSSFVAASSPLQLPQGQAVSANPIGAILALFTPDLLTPAVQVATNTSSFGTEIVRQDTRQGQRDSNYSDRYTNENYSNMTRALSKYTAGAVDMRPENLEYLVNNMFLIGPLNGVRALDTSKGDGSAGTKTTEPERYGLIASSLGLTRRVDDGALNPRRMSFNYRNKAYDLMADNEIEINGGTSGDVVANVTQQLQLSGMSESDIELALATVNLARAEKRINVKVSKQINDFRRSVGRDMRNEFPPELVSTIQTSYDEIEALSEEYLTRVNEL